MMPRHRFKTFAFIFLALFSSAAPSFAATDTDLVGLWHMDNSWTDASENGNTGTAYNGATFSTSAREGTHAGSFDGVNDYVSIPATSLLQPANAITVEAWVKPSDVATWHQVVTKRYAELNAPYNSYILCTNKGGANL
jgi:hypothetical protein